MVSSGALSGGLAAAGPGAAAGDLAGDDDCATDRDACAAQDAIGSRHVSPHCRLPSADLLLGFLWFAVTLPQPAGAEHTDAAIVLTGGPGRIPRAMAVLRHGLAPRLLVSGVDPEVLPREFQSEYDVPDKLMRCCVTLGFRAYDTRSNAVGGGQLAAHQQGADGAGRDGRLAHAPRRAGNWAVSCRRAPSWCAMRCAVIPRCRSCSWSTTS